MTAEASHRTSGSVIRTVAQATVVVVLLGYVGHALYQQWGRASESIRLTPAGIGWLIAASLLLLANYAVLVETWRRVLAGAGGAVPWMPAVRIWTVSNLGKYVPGLVWQISAMTVMLRQFAVGAATAATAAAVVTVGNVAAGAFVAATLGGVPALRGLYGQRAVVSAAVVLTFALVAYGSLPALLPRIALRMPRALRARLEHVRVSYGALVTAFVGCGLGWLMSGASFALFAQSMLGRGVHEPWRWIAAYVASYLIGYVAPFAPGGIGVREAALYLILPALHLATSGEAAALALTSRLWLTVMEIGPGLLFLPAARRAR